MSDTPRTNKDAMRLENGLAYAKGEYVSAELCREMERENADLKRQVEEANERTDDLIAAQIDAQAKLVKARQQVAEAQKAIKKACADLTPDANDPDAERVDVYEVRLQLRSAIAAASQ